MKKTLLLIAALAVSLVTYGRSRNSFGIIVDKSSAEHCSAELEAYRLSVVNDGLDAFISAADWANPEQVRDSIRIWYDTKSLEGVVFVGDIPVPMVFGAQHFASAFKMDENMSNKRDTSIPSDRFYDDFGLKFDFICRDSVETDFFYYRLSGDCPQEINCDIYSGRIHPSSDFQDKYVELSKYLKKIVRVKSEHNKLDVVTSYTGEGSFSNSLTAWKDETITLAEQFPQTQTTPSGSRFYIYSMTQFPKFQLLEEIQRKDLDLIFFHEHGVPERQYVSNIPEAGSLEDYFEFGRYSVRQSIRTNMRYGSTLEEAVAKVKEKYPYLDSTWFSDPSLPETALADSLLDAKTGIMLKDIWEARPNVKVALFDACYNGDFRESDCVAARYIFSDGDCVIGLGNTVNVLQDKSSSDLLGLLAAGYRVGQVQQMTNIMESHIHGDPTFRFTSSYDMAMPDFYNSSIKYWKKYLSGKYPCDVRGLALYKLYRLGCPGLSQLLLDTYRSSDEYMLRLQCMHLLAHYGDGLYADLLEEALDDPYEFIRRKAANFSYLCGEERFIDALARMYLRDFNYRRVAFNIEQNCTAFGPDKFITALEREVENSGFIYDKEKFLESPRKAVESGKSIMGYVIEAMADKESSPKRRALYVNSLRNNPFPYVAENIIAIVSDPSEDTYLRTTFAEALGWYVRAYNRADIVSSLQQVLDTQGDSLDAGLSAEILKSINRLKDYLR